MPTVNSFEDLRDTPAVRGFLHQPDSPSGHGLVLTHGAGGNAGAPLLVAVADAFAAADFTVLRCNLPFRQARPHGLPYPATAAQDRAGLHRAVMVMRERLRGRVFLGGHSYGGRQATMLAASEPELAAGLMLLSYPLHAPGRTDLRTAHFPQLTAPALFLHGTRDPFGTLEEMRTALAGLGGPHELVVIEGAGHDLGKGAAAQRVAATALEAFQRFAKLKP